MHSPSRSEARASRGGRALAAGSALLLAMAAAATRAQEPEAGICASPAAGSLLARICTLEGSSNKAAAEFDLHFLPGGATARLVIARPLAENAELTFRALLVWDLARHRAPSARARELRVLAVGRDDEANTVLTLALPRVPGWWPYLDAAFMVAALEPRGKVAFSAERTAAVSSHWFAIVVSATLVAMLYVACARWFGGDGWHWSPLEITAGSMGRGSLSKLQIFFFSFVVLWLLAYILLRTGELSALSNDVLMLLGISAAGSAASKKAAVSRNRLEAGNWAWLVARHAIRPVPERHRPSWNDLVLSGGEFDVSKFQMLAFNLVVALALVTSGLTALADFTIPETLLGVLGLSQVVYLGGKVLPANPVADLDRLTTELRELEQAFTAAVADKWSADPPEQRTPPARRNQATARADALREYDAFVAAAQRLAELIKPTLGALAAEPFDLKPSLPR